MDPVNKERVNQFYNDGLKRFGYDIKALASGVEERRKIRFKILSEAGLTSGCSVLDLGCGFGDFYGYLRERAISVQYIGYDINPNLIEVAKQVYPEAEFYVRDIQAEPFPEFDYIVSTSAFNHPLIDQDQYQFAQDILTICYNHVRQGVAIDFLTSYVDFKSPILFHYSPERMFSIAKKITKKVCLRHDYPLFDFCIYLYPDFTGWQNEKDR